LKAVNVDKRLLRILRLARRAQDIKQSELAGIIGISQPLMSQLENGWVPLSKEKLLRIAGALGIDPGFIDDPSVLPFGSDNFFKMFLLDNHIMGIDYCFLERLVEFVGDVDVIFLLAVSKSEIFDKCAVRTIIERFSQAVLLRDRNDNFYLFRRRSKSAHLVGECDLRMRLEEKARREGRTVRFGSASISEALLYKINDLTVEREDVDRIFDVFCEEPKCDKEGVEEIIEKIKGNGHNPGDIFALMGFMKERGLSFRDVLELCQKSRGK